MDCFKSQEVPCLVVSPLKSSHSLIFNWWVFTCFFFFWYNYIKVWVQMFPGYRYTVPSKQHQPGHGSSFFFSSSLWSSFLRKQPVLIPFSAVHVVSFWHLKTRFQQNKSTLLFAWLTLKLVPSEDTLWVSISPTLPQQHIKAVSVIMPGSSTDTA